MTEDMIELARRNAADAGSDNVEFLHGSIEDIPLPDGSVDVVLSNCVINFSNDKPRVFREACRVLAARGRMVVSDIVALSPLPAEADAVESLRTITGCTNGIMQADDYERMIRAAGFEHVRIEPKTRYTLEVLREKAERKGRMKAYALIDGRADADGVCGSVIIYAEKG